MNDESDSRMVRLPVRDMRDEPAPQRAGGVIQQAINVLERYAPQHGNPDDMESALASLRAAQEGDLPPLLTDERIHEIVREAARGSALRPVGSTPTSVRIARAIESEVRTAIAAAGGGVPQGWKLVPVEPTSEMIQAAGRAWVDQRRIYRDMLASSPQPEAAQSPAEKEVDAIAELNHQQWLALGQCAALVSACHRLSAESEEYDFDDGLGRGAQQAYWDEFDSALERASEALDQANKETQRIHATQFVQPSQPEAAPAVAQVPQECLSCSGMGGHEKALSSTTYTWVKCADCDGTGKLAAATEAPAQAAQSAGEVERGDVVAFEFYNRATGHAIVDYSVNTHVGNLSAAKGYEARPLVYAAPRQNVLDGSKPIPAWQAREALDELEAAARGDAPFNHQAAAVVRAALSHKEQP